MVSVFMYIVRKWIDEIKSNTDIKTSMSGCIILRIKLGKNNDISPIPSIIKINGDTIIPINIVDNDIFLNRFIIIGRIKIFAEMDNIILSYNFWTNLFLKVLIVIFLKIHTILIVATNDNKNPESIM